MSENKNLLAKKTFILALESHRKDDLQSAINLYNEVLKIDSSYAEAHNNLGVIFQETGNHLKVIPCFEKAIQIKPNYEDALHNLGFTFQSLDQPQKAIPYFEKVIQINPNYAKAYNSLGTAFQTIKEFQKAKVSYETAIKIKPNFLKANNNLGIISNILGDKQKAIACFEKAIQIDPNYETAINNLGTIFKEAGDDLKAKEYFERALKIQPNNVEALNNLGIVFKDLGDNQKAKEIFEKALKLDSRSIDTLTNIANINFEEFDIKKAINSSYKVIKTKNENFKFIDQSISLNRLKHDVGQANYISQTDGFWKFSKLKYFKIKGIDEFKKMGSKILSRRENKNKNDNDKKIILTPDEVNVLLPFYKADHIYKPKIISGSCINPNKNWQVVEDEFFNSKKQIIYIDDFLSEEALMELRKFSLISKVWNKEYNDKYFGAFSDHGFISPIHLQIGIELKKELPKLFGLHILKKILGFKYDSTLSKRVNIYGDFATYNLNFWITPDEFNNNKNTGGLKVYDVPAPENWTLKDYNNNKIHKYLEDSNAKCVNVPYKFNRAVLFNSTYFYETDEIDFLDKYEGRRINMTYLFGSGLAKT